MRFARSKGSIFAAFLVLGLVVTAFPANTSTLTPPTLLEGRWLNPGEKGVLVLNQITRKNAVPGIGAGDDVQLLIAGNLTTWEVVGIVEERAGHGGVYATAEGLADALGSPQLADQFQRDPSIRRVREVDR